MTRLVGALEIVINSSGFTNASGADIYSTSSRLAEAKIKRGAREVEKRRSTYIIG